MTGIGIVASSAADIPPHVAQALDITIVPCQVVIGQETYRDGVDLEPEVLTQTLRSTPALVRTASASVGDLLETYTTLAAKVNHIISIHLSPTMSTMYNTARLAADMASDVDITLINSNQVSMCTGWLAIAAARAAQAGQSVEEIVQLLETMASKLRLLVYIDDLQYLRRSGRVSAISALLGAMLNVKPLIAIQDGAGIVLERVRSASRALSRLARIATADGSIQEVMILHVDAPETAEALRAKISPYLGDYDIQIAQAGSTISTHVGPGAVSLNIVAA